MKIRHLCGGVALMTMVVGAQADVQTVYMCSMKDGHNISEMADLSAKWSKELSKRKGGDKFKSSLAVPVAGGGAPGRTFAWIGMVPDWATYAAMADGYEANSKLQDLESQMNAISECSESSLWQTQPLN